MGRHASIREWIPICAIGILAASFQSILAQPTRNMDPSERMFLEIILRDTTSRTVCYVKDFFKSSLPDPFLGQLVLLKNRKRNLFVRDASERVYEAVFTREGPALRRIDSSLHFGDNYRMMAFERNDTLYQFGGYGFWRTRDFFTKFDADKGDWHYVHSGRAIPGEYSLHHYDRMEDAFYILDGESSTGFLFDAYPNSDSVYRYLFKERTWRSIGILRKEHRDGAKRAFAKDFVEFVFTDFGVVQLSDPVVLYDFKGNRVMKAIKGVAERVKPLRFGYGQSFFDLGHTVLFHLNDSLHAIATKNGVARHLSIPLTHSDFDASKSTAFYDPSMEPERVPAGWMTTLAVSAVIGSGSAFLFWRRARGASTRGSGGMQTQRPELDTAPSVALSSPPVDFPEKARRFLNSLTSTEQELLRAILSLSLKGQSMDIDNFNRTIGVAHKEDGVKKTRRSLVISKINDSYSLTMGSEIELVTRSKDPEDKRSNRYQLSEGQLPILHAIFEAADSRDA